MLKIIYTVFLGIMLVLFVALGISVFYPSPEAPELPETLRSAIYDEYGEEEIAQQKAYDNDLETYQNDQLQPYDRNVSLIATALAVVFMVVGVAYASKLDVLADGLLLGGIFTLLYGMGRGLASEDEMFRFVLIAMGLLIALGLGYSKFAKPETAKTPAKKTTSKARRQ